jgi:hypothetical protein
MQSKDLFICHASEDKANVVRPLVKALEQAGISCWLDEAEILWGDSITRKINEGLSKCRYVIVVLSPAFLTKNWPQRELDAVTNIEASTGEVRVLPLLVGSPEERTTILKNYSLLNDKLHFTFENGIPALVEAILKRLNLGMIEDKEVPATTTLKRDHPQAIPLPIIPKVFTQLEKDKFLKQTFTVIRGYFSSALTALEQHSNIYQTDLSDIHNFKFICKIYVQGELAEQCKIWTTGSKFDSIAYCKGNYFENNDNSLNESFSVVDNGLTLGLKPLGISMLLSSTSKQFFSQEGAAEYLWRDFTNNLNKRTNQRSRG